MFVGENDIKQHSDFVFKGVLHRLEPEFITDRDLICTSVIIAVIVGFYLCFRFNLAKKALNLLRKLGLTNNLLIITAFLLLLLVAKFYRWRF